MRDKAVSQCLVCKKREDSLRRGLCNAHYQRFIRQCRKLTEGARERFEGELIEKKLLLPSKVGGRPSEHSDPFAEIAAKYEHKQTLEEQVAEDKAILDADLDRILPPVQSKTVQSNKKSKKSG